MDSSGSGLNSTIARLVWGDGGSGLGGEMEAVHMKERAAATWSITLGRCGAMVERWLWAR